MAKWHVVYEKAIRDDGSLFFEKKLTREFLEDAKRTMGSFLFANQYQNEIIPEEEQVFKPAWNKYYDALPACANTFVFIDPAISQEHTADYTGIVVVDVDINNYWYVKSAIRERLTPTEIVKLVFEIEKNFKPNIIGIEDVAYQKALLYFLDEEMRRRKVVLPVKGIRPGNQISKETRIRGLVPRFEFGRIFLNKGLYDLEIELAQFPRSAHDDIVDALSQIEQIAFYPQNERIKDEEPSTSSPEYESWYIRNLHRINRAREREDDFGDF